jgi:hypothetical protein
LSEGFDVFGMPVAVCMSTNGLYKSRDAGVLNTALLWSNRAEDETAKLVDHCLGSTPPFTLFSDWLTVNGIAICGLKSSFVGDVDDSCLLGKICEDEVTGLCFTLQSAARSA